MKDCESILGWMHDYYENQLDVSQRTQIARHLETCEDCSQTYGQMEMLFAELPAALAQQPTPEFERNLATNLETQHFNRKRLALIKTALLFIVCALLSLLIPMGFAALMGIGPTQLVEVVANDLSRFLKGEFTFDQSRTSTGVIGLCVLVVMALSGFLMVRKSIQNI